MNLFSNKALKGIKMKKKYKRMCEGGVLGGVLSGIAYYFQIQTWIVRLIFVILAFVYDVEIGGISLFLVYILIYFLAPEYEEDPTDYEEVCE
jgi:phage shock protein PspC (stress-responsive transcriptional regulator)